VTSAGRRRVLRAVVLAVAVWPALHVVAVRLWLINPWELGGWAMYAALIPDRPITITVDRPGLGPITDPARLPVRTVPAFRAYQDQLRDLGLLADPRPLARALLAATGAPGLEVAFADRRLDHRSARITFATFAFRCQAAADVRCWRVTPSASRSSPPVSPAAVR
jgi:hypothetical protein